MALSMKEKKAVAKETAKRYQKATKKERGLILDEFTSLTSYTRCYASFILRNWKRKIRLRMDGKELVVVLGGDNGLKRRKKKRIYDQKVFSALKKIWGILNCPCGKRLYPFLPEIILTLERFGEIKLDEETREKFLKISPATIDRLLSKEKKKIELKGRSTSKPKTLLKVQIPIRTSLRLE